MLFLPPNQQRQSTVINCNKGSLLKHVVWKTANQNLSENIAIKAETVVIVCFRD